MKLIARFVGRPGPTGPKPSKGKGSRAKDSWEDPDNHALADVLLVSLAKGQTTFKGNMVYELVDNQGVIELREVGKASIIKQGIHWGNEYHCISTSLGPRFVLTEKELDELPEDLPTHPDGEPE